MSVNVGDIIAHLILDKSKFKRALDGSSKDIAGYISSTVGMMARWGARVAAIGTAAFVGISVAGAKFEHSIRKTSAMAGKGFDVLAKKARALGKTTAFSAKEVADAMYSLASAGMDAKDVITSIEPALLLAGASSSDLSASTAILASTMSVFGLKAKDAGHIADVYAKAIDGSQLTMHRLTEAMKDAGPIGKQLGWTFEKTTAALMAMSQANIVGTRAGTALRGGMAFLAKQGDKTTAALKRLGLSYEDVNVQTHSFEEIIKRLADAGLKDLKDGIDIFGLRAQGVMSLLIGRFRSGEQSIKDYNKTLLDSGGYAKTKYEKMMSDVWGMWKGITSRMAELGLSLYDTWKDQLHAAMKELQGVFDDAIDLVNNNQGSFKAFFKDIAAGVRDVLRLTRALLYPIGKLLEAYSKLKLLEAGLSAVTAYYMDKAGPAVKAMFNKLVKMQIGKAPGEAAAWIAGVGGLSARGGVDNDEKFFDDLMNDDSPAKKPKKVTDETKKAADKVTSIFYETSESITSNNSRLVRKSIEETARSFEELKKKAADIWRGIGDSMQANVFNVAKKGLTNLKTESRAIFSTLFDGLAQNLMAQTQNAQGQMRGGFASDLFGGAFGHTVVGGMLGGAVLGAGISAIMGGNNNVGMDDRTKADQYTSQVNSAREQAKAQAKALADAMNSGEMEMDSGLLQQLTSFQFADPSLSYHHHRRGGLNKRSKTEYWSLTNEAQIQQQLAQFGNLMEQVQGTAANAAAFQEATGQAAFTGSGSKVINNLTINNGVLVADERTKDSFAKDIWDRLMKMGVVVAYA